MELGPEALRHVAKLARITLSEDELTRLGTDVAAVLTLFESLPDANAEPVRSEPVPSRADEAAPVQDGLRARLAANVPDAAPDGRLRVGARR